MIRTTNKFLASFALIAFSHIPSANAESAQELSSLPDLLLGPSNPLRQTSPHFFDKVKNKTYQIGDEWGKTPIKSLEDIPQQAHRIAQATAKVGGGTGFYIGKYAGQHIMATNNHVCAGRWSCRKGESIHFTQLNEYTKIDTYLGGWSDVDLALFSIKMNPSLEETLAGLNTGFNFDLTLYANQQLMTFGYGVANNSARSLVGNWDSDCKVASPEVRYMGDPDTKNPGSYKTWSFSNGCDVSHGDSGSAMIDANTGDVIGLIWTGKIPKSAFIQNSETVVNAINDQDDEIIWNELSYGVPAVKIKSMFETLIREDSTSTNLKEILRSILGN